MKLSDIPNHIRVVEKQSGKCGNRVPRRCPDIHICSACPSQPDMSIRDVPNAGEVYPVWNMCGECEAQRSRDQKCLARNFSLTGSGNCRLRYVRLCRGIIRGVPEAGKMYPV